jgi:O-acetyl-ADP-ribose deacetylase (regulator of RNase III)
LQLAVDNGARTVAFPAISCGVYGYPLEKAARIAVSEVAAFLEQCETIDEVLLVCFGAAVSQAYRDALQGAAPPS